MIYRDFKILTQGLFFTIEPVLEMLFPVCERGRTPTDKYDAFETMMYKFYTGIQWRMLDGHHCKVKGSTAHNIFQKWASAGVFDLLFALICCAFDKHIGFKFEWSSVDATKCQAPVRNIAYGEEGLGHNPTDRGFKGTKISAFVDEEGNIAGFVIAGANVHDSKLLEDTILDARRYALYLNCSKRTTRNLCLDKGYFGKPSEITAFIYGFVSHIQSRGEEKQKKIEGQKARRWVVERAFAWLKGCRSVRTRYCQKLVNFQAVARISASLLHMRKILEVITLGDYHANIVPEKILELCLRLPAWEEITQRNAMKAPANIA